MLEDRRSSFIAVLESAEQVRRPKISKKNFFQLFLLTLGTFITLDICISRLEDVGTADIRGTVEKIRAQRAYSIQMPDQYVFCHLALIEYALAHKHLSPDINLEGFDDNDNSDSD